nr:SoxR reducing system RseC family protein [Neobacillus sp. Marseille-Q6967]
MFIIATFENSIYIELAVTALEQQGISKEKILAAPLDKRKEPRQLFDSIHKSDGFSLFDVAAILGTCFMLLGAIYGYVLEWGPIIWGIIGAVSGMLAGFFLKLFILRKNKRGKSKITSEIVLMVRCDDPKVETVEGILWDHHALGLTKI